MSNYSENEDDPFCSSGEDWVEEEDTKGKGKKKGAGNKKRASTRLSKKPRMMQDYVSSEEEEEESGEEEEEEEEEDVKPSKKKRNGVQQKKKGTKKEKDIDLSDDPDEGAPLPVVTKPGFSSGAFVIAKEDAKGYDAANPPHIWRIDGKALLQKFEPFEHEGGTQYKNTSIYTGWSAIESDKYAPLKDINVILNTNQKFILSFDFAQLKEIVIDSD